jgi:hypothetical protein
VTVRQLVGPNLSVLSVSECGSRLYMVNQPSRLIPGLELSVWLVQLVTLTVWLLFDSQRVPHILSSLSLSPFVVFVRSLLFTSRSYRVLYVRLIAGNVAPLQFGFD